MPVDCNVLNAASREHINYRNAAVTIADKDLVCPWVEPDVVGIVSEGSTDL